MEETKELITTDDIRSKVYIIRGQQVMLDKDLAEIYGYDVKRLNEQVKRNINRFPEDFMFQLKASEITDSLKSQFATLNVSENKRGMHIKKMPFAFTEQGIYMLATVLRGELAEQQSIFIMRTFREMRHYIKQNQQFVTKSEMDLENHLYKTYDKIDEAEELLVSAKAKKRSLLADKITGDNIYKTLIFFDKLYAQMNESEKREFLSQLVDNTQIYEERKENGQWLKSIEFKLPIIEKEFTLSLDNDTQNETVVLLSK